MQPMPEPTVAEIEREVVHMTTSWVATGERYRPILDSLTGHLEAADASARRRRGACRNASVPPRPIRGHCDTPLHLDTAARSPSPMAS